MNERIRELERQCWTNREDGLFPGQSHFDAYKFAELIVKECIGACLHDDWEDPRWARFYANKIKQHFGVE